MPFPRRIPALVAAVAVPALVAGTAALPAHASTPAETSSAVEQGITAVRAADDTVTVEGTAAPGDDVEIHALPTWAADDAWTDDDPVAVADADSAGEFTAAIDRPADDRELYYAKYVAVSDDTVLGTYHYVDDVATTPTNSYPYPDNATKKGLQVQMTADAEELGIGHAGINVAFNQVMQLEDAGNGASIPFTYDGEQYWFDAAAVAGLDRQIKPLSDNGQVVNLILILYRDERANSAWHVLKHPDADLSGGPVFAFDTETAEGVAHYTAAIEFLAQRYTREDQAYGRATGFIVGNEVDAQFVWQNMGSKPLNEFLLSYERALRLTYLATRTAYDEARTYTSLTHSWLTPSGPTEPAGRYYPGKDVVDGLNALTKAHGDYPWYIAHHPYPENLLDPAFWEDVTATPDPDSTPRITFKNIEVLNEYLQRDEQLYDGEPRRVILSEQGCNTPGTSREAEELQAACYALAYYKIFFLDAIDSFILHRHVDHKHEGGLRLGLWSWNDELSDPAPPLDHKLSYDVFRYIDTERSLEVTEFAKDVIGIDDWSELVDGWDPDALAVRPLEHVVGASATAVPQRERVVSDFEEGTERWRSSDAVDGVTAEDGYLRSSFRYEQSTSSNLAKLWRGTDVALGTPLDASAAQALSVRVRIPAAADIGARYVKVKAYGSDGTVAAGATRLAENGEWQRALVDLRGWEGRGSIERIKVWARGDTDRPWAGSFDIDDVVLARAIGGPPIASNLEVDVTAPKGLEAGAPVRVTVRNDDLNEAVAPLEVVACDGVTLTDAEIPVRGLAPGESATIDTSVAAADPADPLDPAVCFSVLERTYTERIDVPPPPVPVATPLYDFDDGTTQGWVAGAGMASVAAAQTTANGPGSPQAGSHTLDGTAVRGPSTDPKTMLVEPDEPLDLSDAAEVVGWVNSYGGAPGATGYQVTFTLWSGDDELAVTQAYRPDGWNEVVLDVSGWAGRSAVDRIEVTMHAVGEPYPTWDPHLQLDSVGWFAEPRT